MTHNDWNFIISLIMPLWMSFDGWKLMFGIGTEKYGYDHDKETKFTWSAEKRLFGGSQLK